MNSGLVLTKIPAFLICSLILFLCSCTLHSSGINKEQATHSRDGYQTLARFPFREAWYGIYYQDDKIGYSHFRIDPGKDGFVISFDSLIRLKTKGKTDEIDLTEKVQVKPDLTLVSFDSVVNMNAKRMEMRGIMSDKRLDVDISVGGETLKHPFKLEGTIYHASSVSLMPALKGLTDGQSYTFTVFNAEKQRLETVDQQIFRVRGQAGPKGSVWKVKNAYGEAVVHSWLNEKGLTVIEKGGSEPLMTVLEDEESARKFRDLKT